MNAVISFAFFATLAVMPVRDAVVNVDAESRISADDPAYEQGTDLLDEHEWRRAIRAFAEVERLHGPHADAALYWQAYAYDKLAMRADALARLVKLRKSYPKSRWIEDANALEVEIRHSMGEVVRPDEVPDDDVKIIAISGLMAREPLRAVPILDGILRGDKPRKVKERALFVLAQSDAPEAHKVLIRVAEDNENHDLQEHAIKYLAVFGGDANRTVLAQVYARTPSVEVKRSILHTYCVTGDRARLLALAKTERNEELRRDAVLQLGVTGAAPELGELYAKEQSIPVRKGILQAMFVGGSSDKLVEIAQHEQNLELKRLAIRDVALLGSDRSAQKLIAVYDADGRREVRTEIINALMLQGNVPALRGLARRERDVQLKREIEMKLGTLNGKVPHIEIHVDDDDE